MRKRTQGSDGSHENSPYNCRYTVILKEKIRFSNFAGKIQQTHKITT